MGPPLNSHRAIRGARYQRIRARNDPALDQLHDLWRDLFEAVNRLDPGLPGLSGEAALRLLELRDRLGGLRWGSSSTRLP